MSFLCMAFSPAPGAYFRDWWPNSGGNAAAGAGAGDEGVEEHGARRALATGSGTSTITNRYGVYQQDTAATNYFAGNVIIGTDPGGSEKLRVGGTARFSGKITTVSVVPASFADLAAVRTWLAANFT
mgnify:CR=1 FL=1